MRVGQIPALAGAALLHAGVLAALLYLNLNPAAVEVVPTSMTVSLVPKGPSAAPVVGPAQPLEEAPAEVEPAPPEPAPATPAPPPPAPAPAAKVATKPEKTTPAPPKKPEREVDPCQLVGSCATPSRGRKAPPMARQGTGDTPQTGAQKGPVTDPKELNGLVNKVGSLWQLDCEVGQTRKQVVKVQFTILGNGQLAGRPEILNRTAGSVFADAAGGAVRAVQAGAPYSLVEVPTKLRNVPIIVNFHAAQVCASR